MEAIHGCIIDSFSCPIRNTIRLIDFPFQSEIRSDQKYRSMRHTLNDYIELATSLQFDFSPKPIRIILIKSIAFA